MLLTKWKASKNKKAMTLVEMVVAIAVTAILAVCLSLVMSPVMKTYSVNKARAEIANYADRVLNNIASDLRGAGNVMLVPETKTNSSPAYSLPGYTSDMPRIVEINYCYCLHDLYKDATGKSMKGTPVLSKVNQYNDPSMNMRQIFPAHLKYDHAWPPETSGFDAYSTSDGKCINYTLKAPLKTTSGIIVQNSKSFYILVRKNPDDSDRGNVLEIHLDLMKGKVKYSASKTVVCENLVLNKMWAQKATIVYNGGGICGKDNAEISTSDVIGKTGCIPYYSVWYGIGINQLE